LDNEFDVEFDLLKQVKIERDRQGKSLNERFSLLMTSSTGKKIPHYGDGSSGPKCFDDLNDWRAKYGEGWTK